MPSLYTQLQDAKAETRRWQLATLFFLLTTLLLLVLLIVTMLGSG